MIFFTNSRPKRWLDSRISIGSYRPTHRGVHKISHLPFPILFYDGECAICHGGVRFLLDRDKAGRLHFAPIGGETWEAVLPADFRANPPDSVVLVIARGSRPLVRSRASLAALGLLGPPWNKRAALLGRIPEGLRDGVYRVIAALRKRVLGAPKAACPRVPPELRPRLLP